MKASQQSPGIQRSNSAKFGSVDALLTQDQFSRPKVEAIGNYNKTGFSFKSNDRLISTSYGGNRNSTTPTTNLFRSKNLPPVSSIQPITSINNFELIQVNPTEVIFKDINSKQTYETIVVVQSLSKVLNRVRIVQPQTPRFRVDYDMTTKIAAGLSLKLVVTFEASISDDYHDKMIIQYEKEGIKSEVLIPLHAFRPQASIVFEPFLNFGFVRQFENTMKIITFKNVGKIAGKIILKYDHLSEILCDPSILSILPGQILSSKITFNSKESGVFRGRIEIKNEGQSLQKYIDVNATSVEFNKFFVDESGASTSTFDFGETYFGQKKVIKCFLVNNTPINSSFKVNMRIGFHLNSEEKATLQTPIEVGIEQTEQIMKCIPSQGFVAAYSQVEVQLLCHSKVLYEHQIITKNFALSEQELMGKNDSKKKAEEDHTYSAIFEFINDGQKEIVPLTLIGKVICPKIKISQSILAFGECRVHDHKESLLVIENQHNIPIDVKAPRIPSYFVEPASQVLTGGMKSSFIVTFQPVTVGKFKTFINVTLLNGTYKIPIQVVGEANNFLDTKEKKTRGPESLPQDFKLVKNFIDHRESQGVLSKQIKTAFQSESNSLIKLPRGVDNIETNFEKLEELRTIKGNKDKYIKMLNNNRQSRILKEKEQIVKLRLDQMETKLKEKGLTLYQDEGDEENEEKDPRKTVPLDLEFELGMMDTKVFPPSETHESLQITKDPLFVSKPIGKYEPLREELAKVFEPDSNILMRKPFSEVAKTHKEIRDIRLDLTGEMLQKISIGPKDVNFGSIYIESKVVKCFCVKNDLRSSIKVQLYTTAPELQGTYTKPQIIPSSEIGRFDIQLYSTHLNDNFIQTIKYVINDHHSFEFQVIAQIQKVKLDLIKDKPDSKEKLDFSKEKVTFQFSNDSNELETKEIIIISNQGNADGHYKWDNLSKIFLVSPLEGIVPAKSSVQTTITYKPSPSKETILNIGQRIQAEKLNLYVKNGIEQSVNCEGIVNEAKCFIKQQQIEIGQLIVGKEETRVFQIKNTSRIPAIFRIQADKLPEGCISPISGKIQPDGMQECIIKYSCKEEKDISTDISVLLRGGKVLKLPFSVSTIIPKVIILEEKFDFGKIIKDNSGSLEMTLFNDSQIPAELILDLRSDDENRPDQDKEHNGIKCLKITPLDDQGDESILKSIHQDIIDQEEKNASDENQIEMDEDKQSVQSDESLLQTSPNKRYNITIKPKQKLPFLLTFTPDDSYTYSFKLPISLARFGQSLPGLEKMVSCTGQNSNFNVNPQKIEFLRKIISSSDKNIPEYKDIAFSNPEKKTVYWRIDVSDLEKYGKVFSITPKSGQIDPDQTITIKSSFDPKEPGEYSAIISLYVDNEKERSSTPVHNLIVTGVAAYPRLLFDRREILLPVVPLGVESKCVFRIINDGYENLKINHVIQEELGGFFKVDCRFPEGKNLNNSSSKLKVEVYFSSAKPISFSTKIEFKDDKLKGYMIPVSGTADNCLLTNFPYLQRCKGEYKTEVNPEKGTITLIEDDFSDDRSDVTSNNNMVSNPNRKKYAASVASAKTQNSRASLRSTKSALGYTPVPKEMLDNSKEQIKNWLNFYVLSNNIQNFPDTIVEDNGEQLYELVGFLAGSKSHLLQTKAVFEGSLSRTQRAILLFQQYDRLIRLLKQEGALLNHVRPQYLLAINEYHAYIKTLPKEEVFLTHPNGLIISQHRYSYFQADAWISIFYQLIKVYYLSRINVKQLRTIPNLSIERVTCPDSYLKGSNIFSSFEGILLRWLELNHEMINPHLPLRILSFDKELANGHIIANIIKNYLGIEQTSHLFTQMKPITSSDDENYFNCDKVHNALQEINLQTPFNAVDLSKSSQRETVLFILQLFNSIPNYIPKGPPIVFSCVLGEEIIKTIELHNPSNKTIHYWVKYNGSPDFHIEADTVKLDPNQRHQFKIKFISRVSQHVFGRIRFTNKRDSNVAAAALVFDFASNITGRISSKFSEVESPLYQKKEFTIKVENKFMNSSHADFQITIMHEFEMKKYKIEEIKKSARSKDGGPIKQLPKNDKEEITPQESLNAVPSFFLKQADTLTIKKGSFSHLSLVFIPIIFETQKCYIIFSDPNVGEFQYQVTGSVFLPEEIIELPENPIQPPIYVEDQRNWSIKIPFKNESLKEARKNIENFINQRYKKKEFDSKKYTLPNPSPDIINFFVELEQTQNNFISAPKSIVLDNPIRSSKRKPQVSKLDASVDSKRNIDGISNMSSVMPLNQANAKSNLMNDSQIDGGDPIEKNCLYINFNFKMPVRDYTCNILLKNPEKYDIRRYKLVVSSLPKPIKASLEMTVSAREFIIQEIPIFNFSEKDWVIKINIYPNEEMNGKYFFVGQKPQLMTEQPAKIQAASTGLLYQSLRDVVIKKKSTVNIPVGFAPTWIGQSEARLVMTNPITSEVYDYELKGISEEPLAVDHLIINGQARSTKKQDIIIKNPYSDKSITYEVETDLVGASGPAIITINPNKRVTYSMFITPLLSGQYTGSITFTDTLTGEYLWWTVLLNTESPPSTKKIDMITTLRKAIVFNLEIMNPSNETANFEVFIEGEGLVGVPYLTISPKSTQQYELFFLPFQIGRNIGSIAFVSDTIGEIWYELNLIAEDSSIVRLSMLKTELGKVEQHEVRLDNPSNEEVRVKTQISNPANFDVFPEQIVIPAHEEISVFIRYTPSMLDVAQISEIKFLTDKIGRWDFLAYGMGIPPTSFEPKIVTVGLNKEFSSVIHFKNPFKDSIQVSIFLEAEEELVKQVVQLLSKKSGKEDFITIQGHGIIQIPFSFTPREIRSYICNIIVSMNDKIQWKYPINASTESLSTGVLSTFKTKCRILTEGEFKVTLPGITQTYGESDTFSYEIKNMPQIYESVIQKSFQIRMVKNSLSNKSDQLMFSGRFHPMKPFKTSIDFIVNRKRGGVWKFKIYLESSPPHEDDVIVLSAPLESLDSISFRLTNRVKSFASFIAKFAPESDPEFLVSPKTGILEPYGRNGTNFTVSFSPIEYGKAKTAKLIIETEDMYWSYLLKGVLPKYDPPIGGISKINNRLGAEVTTNWRHQKKNFLSDNIKNTKEGRPQTTPAYYEESDIFNGQNESIRKKGIITQRERQSILDFRTVSSKSNSKVQSLSKTINNFFKFS